jgi:flavin reductase (DIM6/NTAB) family NADH-FMN oxidoreductase RutF
MTTLHPKALRQLFSMYPTGVTIVTCRDGTGQPVGITANSFASVSLEPALVLWSIAKTARSAPAFLSAKSCAIHFLADTQAELSNRFAKSGADKFPSPGVKLTPSSDPDVEHALAMLDCVPHTQLDAGDHVVLICRVCSYRIGSGKALAFFEGHYASVATFGSPAAPNNTIEYAKAWIGMESLSFA